MTQIRVNGQAVEVSFGTDQNVIQVVDDLRKRFNTETCIVSNILVDGTELQNGTDESPLKNINISEVRSIEIFTSHPKEVAEETLNCLDSFATQLQETSQAAAEKLQSGHPSNEFMQLIDGLKTFSEAIHQVKIILKTSTLAPLPMLEADLLSILKDLFEFTESGDTPYLFELLNKHLPQNLTEWRLQGIPTLRTSRDS